MKTIIGIDPGNQQSGYVIVNNGTIEQSGVMENNLLLQSLANFEECEFPRIIAIEWIQAMGMAVGKEVFETCMWVGRFVERSGEAEIRLIPRGVIKHFHCGKTTAKDANVAQSLRDKYGQKGTKKEPGFFFGVSSHAWQAFAVAAYVMEGGGHANEILINSQRSDLSNASVEARQK